MPAPDLISLFIQPLNELGLRYMVTGAVAAVVYGEPRLTRDIDVVLDLARADAPRLRAAFPGDRYYVPPVEVVEEEAARPDRGHFNLIHHDTGLRADCYILGRDPLHLWAITRRIRQEVGGIAVWVAPLEYVVLRKLQWYRDGASDRHLGDIRAMLRVSGAELDRQALDAWVERLSLQHEWAQVSA